MLEIKNGNIIVDKPLLSSCERYLTAINVDINNCVVTKEPVAHKNWQIIVRKIAEKKINEWRNAVGATKVILAFGSPTNFRDRLALFQKYKGNRDPSRKPLLLSQIKDLLKSLYYCEMPLDAEADDIISMYQFKGSKQPGTYVICTEDKDAKQTPGFMFNPKTKELRNCTGFGEIRLITKLSTSGHKTYKIDGEGRSFFYYQVCIGDTVDNYKPFPKVLTPYKFYNEFKEIKTDKDAWIYVTSLYKNFYKDITEWVDWEGTVHKGTWVDVLQTYVDVVHMIRWFKPETDRINVRQVLTKFNIEY